MCSERVGKVTAKSFTYESAPWGSFDGKTFPYLNAAILVATRLSAEEVLDQLQGIENELGRKRSTANAPRTIDLDILFYGRQVIENSRLVVPHPHLADRRFVLEPLFDIDPAHVHPTIGLTTRQLLHACTDHQQELTRV